MDVENYFQIVEMIFEVMEEIVYIFSNSEMKFFGNQRDLKQNYLKILKKKEWK